ncbi:hypothetical protein A9798_12485 [Edwardsiella hoshinae]|uniref:Fimbrial protein n=1 Tax=Edwardsiella hoshinae TaxID=93378 RepID=A0ABM6EKR2_9GAMM|nr:DUF5462 family protein [Edwardsiella hoshinae]AOV97683.1 hypothetical protein A9798_12485 [Edwardsiella hoshinae]
MNLQPRSHRPQSRAYGALLALLLLASGGASAAPASEHEQYLGVVNGQVQGNSRVTVKRTLGEPILYRAQAPAGLPRQLLIRHATLRPGDGGRVYLTVRQLLPRGGEEAQLTLKVGLYVDGKALALAATQRGDEVLLSVPAAAQQVVLRSDAPVELAVPANYRGPVQVGLVVEDGLAD